MNSRQPPGRSRRAWLDKVRVGWDRLTEPVPAIQGTESRRRARLLSSLLLAFIAIGLLVVTGRILVDPSFFGSTFIVPAVVIVVFVGAYGLSCTEHYRWGAALTVIAVYLAVFVAVLMDPRPVGSTARR